MTYSEKEQKQQITLGQSNNGLTMLMAISLIVFVILVFVKALWYFNYGGDKAIALPLYYKNVMGLFAAPADLNALAHKPWTLVTHMFAQDNVWKVFSNMLWLWCFGYILQDLTGNKKTVPIFIYGALGGAIGFILAYNFIPSLKIYTPYVTTFGASAGVMAVAVATTIISPNYKIFPLLKGGIPLWGLTAFYFISDFATVSIGDTGTQITHLAGAITGFLFIFFLRMGYDWGEWMNNLYDWFNNLFNPNKPAKGKNIKEELFYNATTTPYKKTPNVTQQRVDDVLDKINQKGYSFLTEEEKDLLKRASEKE